MIQEILSKLTPKQIGFHLSNYTNLYLKPFRAWKIAYSDKNKGYNFVILHLIYYTLLLLLIIKDFYLSVQLAILEILVTIVPFLIFYLPFMVFRKLEKKKKKPLKLFHLLLVIKFQFIPFYILIAVLAKWSEIEEIWILFENSLVLVWLAFIIIVPLLSNIKIRYKLLWQLSNYISLITFFLFLGFTLNKIPNIEKLGYKLGPQTPSSEFQILSAKDSLTKHKIIDDKYLAQLTFNKDSSGYIKKQQFISTPLLLEIQKNSLNLNIYNLKVLDSILKQRDSTHKSRDNQDKLQNAIPINGSTLDSFRKDLNQSFYYDLKLYKDNIEKTKYESNKEYFKLSYEYLLHYESLYKNLDTVLEIATTQKYYDGIKLDEKRYAIVYQLDSTYIFPKKDQLNSLSEQFKLREKRSNYLFEILIKPVVIIISMFNIN